MRKCLLIMATLDTKGKEAGFVRDRVRSLGFDTIVMDVGSLGRPLTDADITAADVLRETDLGISEKTFTPAGRSEAVEAMQKGASVMARRLREEGRMDGIIGLGGGTGTAIASFVMRSLPFGIPKVIVSTVASRDVRQYVGTKDIVMFHSVADLLGSNNFIRRILEQAAGAVCGMMNAAAGWRSPAPMVAVTAYGINSRCAMNVEPFLKERGYEMIGFHANGVGGMAMEEMVGEGLIEGVLDLTPHELADDMFGGYCKGIGRKRFQAAGEAGVPLLLAPGGLDNAVFSAFYPMPEMLKGRRHHDHDDRFCVRMEHDEMAAFARIIAERLNGFKGPAFVLIPSGGFSEVDRPGEKLYDPVADRVFTDELKRLLRDGITLEEMDAHISDQVFARRAVDIIDSMIREKHGTAL